MVLEFERILYKSGKKRRGGYVSRDVSAPMSAPVGGWTEVIIQYENLPQHCLIDHETRIKGPDALLEDTADDFANAARSPYILPCSTV
jgi:hypothetical protein